VKPGVDHIGVSVGALIFNHKGELFLNERSQLARNAKGHWEVPGGMIEFGETRAQAILREIKEEFNIDIIIDSILHTVDEILVDEKQHWIPTTYTGKIKKTQVPKIMEPHKCDEIGWFSLGNLPTPLSYITKLDLEEYYKQNV